MVYLSIVVCALALYGLYHVVRNVRAKCVNTYLWWKYRRTDFYTERYKEFKIDGVICVPVEMTTVDFLDRFIEHIERDGWMFGGGIDGYKEDDDNE
jgi:hypothetical protein